jgi:hypothetical protein
MRFTFAHRACALTFCKEMPVLKILILVLAVIGPAGCLVIKIIRSKQVKRNYSAWIGIALSTLLCYSYTNVWAVAFCYPDWVRPHHDPDTYFLFRFVVFAAAFVLAVIEAVKKSVVAAWISNLFLLYGVVDIYSSIFIFDNYRGP